MIGQTQVRPGGPSSEQSEREPRRGDPVGAGHREKVWVGQTRI